MKWICTRCTLENGSNNKSCSICGNPRPKTKNSSLIPKFLTKPIGDISGALVDIFTVAPSSNNSHNNLAPPRPPPPRPTSLHVNNQIPNNLSPKTPPPPVPPPPVITLDIASRQQENNGSSSENMEDIDYSVNWLCNSCYKVNELTTMTCQCGVKRVLGSKRSLRLTNRGRSVSAPSPTQNPTNYSLCSEITSHVEKQDNLKASEVFNNIMNHCLTGNTSFIDDSFPHSDRSIGDLSTQRNEGVVGTLPSKFLWLRPQSMYTKEGRAMTWEVFRDPCASDIEQGVLGDCWLLSAMALLAERPDILDHIFITKKYNNAGVYQIRICLEGQWKIVLIDDFFPCRVESRALAFATGRKNQLWVSLLEKAIAKAFGSYGNLIGGRTIEGLDILTGAPCVHLDIQSLVKHDNSDLLWAQLLSSREAGFILGCSCGTSEDANREMYKAKGLSFRHAYSILDVRDENGYRLMRLRNPWGTFVWNGEWSDNWNGWDPALKRKLLSQRISGTFWMCFHDFVQYFDSVDIARVQTNVNWNELRIPVQFGGAFHHLDRAVRIIVESPTEITFSLFQSGQRRNKDKVDIMICVHKVTPEGQIGDLCYRSSRRIEYSVSTGENFFSSGHYIIVCHSMTTLGGQKKHGTLVIHSSLPIYADVIPCTSDMYTDSLIQMMLREGTQHNSLEGAIPRYLSKDFAGLMLMVDNITDNRWVHVKTDCVDSLNVISSRGTMEVVDSIPPLSRQIIIILTHFEASNSFVVQHKLMVQVSHRQIIDKFGTVPYDRNNSYLSNASILSSHSVRSIFN